MSEPKWKNRMFRGKLIETMNKDELLEIIDWYIHKDEQFKKEWDEILPELKAYIAIERMRGVRTVVVSERRDGWHNLWGLF